jgi:hypothetical protein
LENHDDQGKNKGTLPKDVTKCRLVFNLLFIILCFLKNFFRGFLYLLKADIYLGKDPKSLPQGSIVVFPYRANTLNCGLAGIVALKLKETSHNPIHVNMLDQMVDKTTSRTV